jgi:hypothetical protein
MNGLGLLSGIAIAAASLSLHSETLLHWIGPAGCIILVPAIVLVLGLPLLWMEKPAPVRSQSYEPVEFHPPGGQSGSSSPLLSATLQTAPKIKLTSEIAPDGTRKATVTITNRYPGERAVTAALLEPDHAQHSASAATRSLIVRG